MTELSRNLLNAAREGLAPDADAAARVRARVAAAVGAGAVAAPAAVKATAAPAASTGSTGSTAAITAASMSTNGLGLAAKIAAALLVVGIAAVALVATRESSPSGGAAALAPAATQTDETAATHSTTASQEQPAPAVTDVTTPDTLKTPAPAPRASLAREVELIDLAMVALRKQTPAAALAAIATFDKETRGRGQMAEDAAAIALEAHCRLGDDVRAKLAAFDATYPSSAQRSRIRDACRR